MLLFLQMTSLNRAIEGSQLASVSVPRFCHQKKKKSQIWLGNCWGGGFQVDLLQNGTACTESILAPKYTEI